MMGNFDDYIEKLRKAEKDCILAEVCAEAAYIESCKATDYIVEADNIKVQV